MSDVRRMNVFGDDEYDLTGSVETLGVNTHKASNIGINVFNVDDTIEVMDNKLPHFDMPKLKSKRTPNPDFYDLDIMSDLPISTANCDVYHDLFSKHMAIGVVNSAKDYLKFGACVVRCTNIPKGVNYDVLLEHSVNLFRSLGRNTTIIKEGNSRCLFVQSKSAARNVVGGVIQYIKEFILSSVETKDYANVIVNVGNILESFDPEVFNKIAGDCSDRCDKTERVYLKLTSLKKDLFAYAKTNDGVGIESVLIDATILYAYSVCGDELDNPTFTECVAYLNANLPKCVINNDLYRKGVVAIVVAAYLERMLKSIKSFQLEGVR